MLFFFSSRRRHTRSLCDWSSDVCSSDLTEFRPAPPVGEGDPAPFEPRPEGVAERHRSEERRVGKECRSRWAAYHLKKKTLLNWKISISVSSRPVISTIRLVAKSR